MQRFQDRYDAGRQLAQRLSQYANRSDVMILALPRGGVPVAYEVALVLNVRLDVWIVRKLGLPGQQELAIGAIASGGIRILNEDIIQAVRLSPHVLEQITQHESEEVRRREAQYRGDRPLPQIRDHIMIVVDDGLATGASMLAALAALRTQQPGRIIVAVPVAAPQAVDLLRSRADGVVYMMAPEPFAGVGKWYEDFAQTTDEEVQRLLAESNLRFSQ